MKTRYTNDASKRRRRRKKKGVGKDSQRSDFSFKFTRIGN